MGGEPSYPVAGRELNAARVLLDNLFHLLPCCCQRDLKHKTLLTLIAIIPDCQQRNKSEVGLTITMLVSSSSCLNCSFFFLASASMCSLNSFSFSSRSSSDADSHRWSFLRLRRVSDQVASDDRT